MAFSVEDALGRLDNNQKIALLTGQDWWHTQPIDELNIPAIRLSDGASGIRGTRFFQSEPAAAIPCGVALGATWDKDLVRQAGQLLAKECIAKGVHCWLGPTVNLHRSPLGGRNNESFGEDPYHVGKLASSIIAGVQSLGVAATIKHFVCNDQEDEKARLNAIVTERALRELHLKPFQIAARDVKPSALMTAYNKLNGYHCSEHPLLEKVVRGEWGWDPLIMSDWFGTFVGHPTINAGLDLEMPGKTMFRGEILETAISTGDVKQSTLDRRVRKVLEFVENASRLEVSSNEGGRDCPEDRELNRKLCASSIVLLKNEGNVLPLSKETKKIALIGSHMKYLSILGLGSTALEPYYTSNPFDAIEAKLADDSNVMYATGVHTHQSLPLLHAESIGIIKMQFFNASPAVADRKCVAETTLKNTRFHLVDYDNPDVNFDHFYVSVQAELKSNTSQLWDFGLSCHGTANLYIDDELFIDNTTVQKPGASFWGLGTVEEVKSKHLEAGRVYKLRLEFGSAVTSKLKLAGGLALGGGGANLGACPHIEVKEGIQHAEEIAREADVAIICTGITGEWEGEGHDRDDMSLPPNVDTLITRVRTACPNTVVVNFSGSPVEMPWADDVPAIVQAWYGGNEAGNGIADVLFGDYNPSGKLPISWPRALQDNPTYLNFGSDKGRCLYGEDIYIGYRYYEKIGRALQWPFGHGLSYSTFELSDLSIRTSDAKLGTATKTFPNTVASLKIMNTSSIGGSEVVQLYVIPPASSSIRRPMKELHGFEKVFVEPGQQREVSIEIDPYAMSYWDEFESCWCIEKGSYTIVVSTSSNCRASKKNSHLQAMLEVETTRCWLGL